MPAGRLQLVNLPATYEDIDEGADRAPHVTMTAVSSLAGWLDAVVGTPQTPIYPFYFHTKNNNILGKIHDGQEGVFATVRAPPLLS